MYRRNFLSFLFCFTLVAGLGQNQKVADSLKSYIKEHEIPDSTLMRIYNDIAHYSPDPDSSIHYASLLIRKATEVNDSYGLYMAYLQLGNTYRLKGDYKRAVSQYLKSISFIGEGPYAETRLTTVYIPLADIYSVIGDYKQAVKYYGLAISTLQNKLSDTEDSILLATAYINLGDAHMIEEAYDSALYYFSLEEQLVDKMSPENPMIQTIKAYNFGNKGQVHAHLSEWDAAEKYTSRAVALLNDLEDFYGISSYLRSIADIYEKKGREERSLIFATESFQIAKNHGFKEHLRDASLILARLYETKKDTGRAYEYLKLHLDYKDSLNNEELIRKIANLRTEYEVGQKQAEVDLLTEQKRNHQLIIISTSIFAFILVVLAVIIFKYYRNRNKTAHILKQQKRNLERLNQTKDKFFSIISHDLRGPISSFMGIGYMIRQFIKAQQPEQLLAIADDIDSSVKRISALLDNLLNWAMQQQGHFPNVPEKLNFNAMAGELIATMDSMAKAKNIELSARLDEEVNLWADQNTTMTIIRNLVNNSLKFTPEGGSVIISAKAKGEMAEIRVVDTGVGIPQDKLQKLFELQAKKSTYGTDGEKGLGLGLQLVYEFVEMNGGSISVDSEEGAGSTFIVRLPLFEQAAVAGVTL